MARKYEKVKALLPDVQQLRAEGKTRKEIAKELGLQSKRAVKDLFYCARHKQEKAIPKQRGRKPAKTLAEYKYENKRLKMENELLRIFCNPKTVLRIMKKYGLLSEIRRRRKWQQMGQQVHKYKNLLNRDFRADKPNSKLVTDISYIHTKQDVLYLSMIRDLYDNCIVAYKTRTEQTVNLVLDTIRLAMKQVKKKAAEELQLHSDQGAQYDSQAYFELTQTYGITPSMLRQGNPYDNAMAENFFSILKTDCIYRHKTVTFSEANEMIDRYIRFYNHERIQLKTGESPLTRRLSYENFTFLHPQALFVMSAQSGAVQFSSGAN